MLGISPDFENDGDKSPACQCGLGKPQGIVQLARRGVKNIPVAQSELFETDGIGNSGLLHGEGITDPEKRRLARLSRFEVRRQRESKAACCPGIPHQERADFRDAVERQAAFQCGVHLRYAEWQAGLIVPGFPAFRIDGRVRLFRRCKRRQGFPFQSGDLFAQGKKRLLRRGVLGHGVSSIRNVLFMFLWIPELPVRVNSQIMGIFSLDPRPMILHSKNIVGGTIWA
ncbi:Hypothetical protein NGAL_HAMBI2610_41690 [Neorhizobium galegae bv. orientalis]|nr:Hypothetical protein NGAL_HAMBI2610_41690 [Neorhizobium galegae bv. orientalis]